MKQRRWASISHIVMRAENLPLLAGAVLNVHGGYAHAGHVGVNTLLFECLVGPPLLIFT